MRILFIISDLSGRSGGPANEVVNVTKAMAAAGVEEVIVATRGCDDSIPLDPRVSLVELPWQCFTADTLQRLDGLISAADYVFVWGVWGPFEGLLFNRVNVFGVPYSCKMLGMLQPYIVQRNKLKKWLARANYVDGNLSGAHRLIVDSTPEGEGIKAQGITTPYLICRNGVLAPAKPPTAPARDGRSCIYFGRIVRKKGLDLLIPVMAKVRQRVPSARLIVVGEFGEADYKTEIVDSIKKHGVDDSIVFKGHMGGMAKWDLLRSASCFLLPSHSEGFPNAMLESLAVGTPIVITPECNFEEASRLRLGVVLPRIEDQWEESIVQLMQGRSAVAPAEEIESYVREHFSWGAVAQKLIALVRAAGSSGPLV